MGSVMMKDLGKHAHLEWIDRGYLEAVIGNIELHCRLFFVIPPHRLVLLVEAPPLVATLEHFHQQSPRTAPVA